MEELTQFAVHRLDGNRWEVIAPSPQFLCGPAWLRVAVVDAVVDLTQQRQSTRGSRRDSDRAGRAVAKPTLEELAAAVLSLPA